MQLFSASYMEEILPDETILVIMSKVDRLTLLPPWDRQKTFSMKLGSYSTRQLDVPHHMVPGSGLLV